MTLRSSTWRVPIALVALGAVPVIAGASRLVELSGGTAALRLARIHLPEAATARSLLVACSVLP